MKIDSKHDTNRQGKPLQSANRAKSMATFKYARNITAAEINQLSTRKNQAKFDLDKPARILLPDFINIPRFIDAPLQLRVSTKFNAEEAIGKLKAGVAIRKKMKDLSLLAEGMKRAKNIKDESRCYYMQAVLLHNCKLYEESIAFLEKFLKIVLFIKDQRSIELSLNGIGIGYMYLSQHEKALSYHLKHKEMITNLDLFFPHVNIGLCLEALGKTSQAYDEYIQAQSDLKYSPSKLKETHVQTLIQRLEDTMVEGGFITNALKDNTNCKDVANSRGLLKDHYVKMVRDSSPKNRQYDNAKVNYAIFSAQDSIGEFMEKMKGSMKLEKLP